MKQETQLIYSREETYKLLIDCLCKTNYRWDVISDTRGTSAFHVMYELKEACIKALQRGVKIRVIGEITKENLFYGKSNMHYFSDARHMDGITGLFIVSDEYYISSPLLYSEIPVTCCIISNVQSLVDKQKALFENLWTRSMPAEKRCKYLESPDEYNYVRNVHDVNHVKQLVNEFIKSAGNTIMIFIPANFFESIQDNSESIQRLSDLSKLGVYVRILVHSCENRNHLLLPNLYHLVKDIRHPIQKNVSENKVEFRYTDNQIPGSQALFMRDSEELILLEIDITHINQLGYSSVLATFSNSPTAILAHYSVFEKYWLNSQQFILN